MATVERLLAVRESGVAAEFQEFWRQKHLCTLTTLRSDGTPHVVPVGAVIDDEHDCVWVITSADSQKVRNIRAAGDSATVAVCQVDGRLWSTLEGRAEVLDDEVSVRRAEQTYASRYRTPRANPRRVAIRIRVTRTLGTVTPTTGDAAG